MKRNLLLLILSLLIYPVFGQIDVRENEAKSFKESIEEKLSKAEYDSTENQPGIAISGFIGQRLLMNMSNSSGFYSGITDDNMVLYKEHKSSQYSLPTTPIDAVKGKYFKVVGYEIVKAKYGSNFNLYFKLLTESNEIVYFFYLKDQSSYLYQLDYNFPFITEGFFKKMKEQCLNKPVVYGYDIYKCIDVFVKDNSNEVSFTIEKDGNQKTASSNSPLYKVKPLKILDFTSDSKYLSPLNSTIKCTTSKKSTGSVAISTMRNAILIEFNMTSSLCFDTDDIITLGFYNDHKDEEYFRGKFNCNGHVYLILDISIERELSLIDYLANNKLNSVYVVGTTSDYITINDPNDIIRNSIKANYNKIIGK